MIKTILFDLDGTLRHSIPAGGDVFADYAQTIGLSISTEERIRAERWEHHYWANSHELRADMEIYSIMKTIRISGEITRAGACSNRKSVYA